MLEFYKCTKIKEGTYYIEIDIKKLFGNDTIAFNKFEKKWNEFIDSDKNNAKVIMRYGNIISYSHKSWIPEKTDSRKSVMFIFGNPAPHSVLQDIYFSYEGDNREHRFWKVMREIGVIEITNDSSIIKTSFFDLEYSSPFRLGFEVIHTFPSSASDKKWSGVAGIEKLFGKKAISLIEEAEKKRLEEIIHKFFKDDKKRIIIFQKNAYNAICSNTYKLESASKGNLFEVKDSKEIYGIPPTRWLYTKRMKELLKKISKSFQK